MDIDEEAPAPVDPQTRFILDLEFVQGLANAEYLRFLAQHPNKYFEQAEFLNYLKYLQYWKKPEYAKFITYPHCLYLLDLLQEEQFRKMLSIPFYPHFIGRQQELHWKYYVKTRNAAPITSTSTPATPTTPVNAPATPGTPTMPQAPTNKK